MMLRTIAFAAALFTATAAHAGINDALECSLPYDAAYQAVTALRLTQTDSLSQTFDPGDARPFGFAPVRLYTVSDGENDVVFTAFAASFETVLASVMARRGLQECPDTYGSRDYCHFAADTIEASLVVQADPDALGHTIVSCSYAHRDVRPGDIQ